jgi:membrane protein implicated in regulation of membrane protease activity
MLLGGGYTLISFLLGGISHLGGHVHIHTDTGHIGGHALPAAGDHSAGALQDSHNVVHNAPGHFPHLQHHLDEGEEPERMNLLRYFNPVASAGFLLGFGGAGIIGRMFHSDAAFSFLIAACGGTGLWIGTWQLITRLFANSGGSSHSTMEEMIGAKAHVTAPISHEHPGMICYIVAGTRQSIRAISEEEELIPTGASVRIHRIENNTALVFRID